MAEYFEQPYPARAAIGVAELPKGAGVRDRGHHGPGLTRASSANEVPGVTGASSLETTPVTVLRGVGSSLAARLEKLGIATVQDLLFLLPLRYEDRTRIVPIGTLRRGDRACLEGTVQLSEVRLPTTPHFALQRSRRHRQHHVAILLFFEIPTGSAQPRRTGALFRRGKTRAHGIGAGAPGVPARHRRRRTAAGGAPHAYLSHY